MKLFKGVAYSRVSTIGQIQDENGVRKEDSSIDTQERRMKDFLEKKCLSSERYEIISYLRDEGLSGSNMNKRPAFQEMWKLIEARKIDFIISTELSRLSRSTANFLALMSHCEKHGVMIFLIKESVDPTTPTGKIFVTMSAVLGEFERDSTVHRVKENAKSRLKVKGRINGGAPILGLVRSKDHKETYLIDQEEKKRLIKVLNTYLASSGRGDALRMILAKNLYDSGGRDFTYCRFTNLLFNVNWRYRGRWYLKDSRTKAITEEVKLGHGPLIDDDLAFKVIAKLEKEVKEKIKCGSRGKRYLLTGVLFDSQGNHYHGTKGNGQGGDYYYYYCKDSNHRINALEIEEIVFKKMLEFIRKDYKVLSFIDKNYKRLSNQIAEKKTQLDEFRKAIKDVDSSIEHQKKLLNNIDLDADAINLISSNVRDYNLKRLELSEKQQQLETSIAKLNESYLTNEIREKIKAIEKSIYGADERKKQKLIREFYDRIIVLNRYEIKIVIKEASDSGALLFEIIEFRDRNRLDDDIYLRKLYFDKEMSLNEISRKLSCSRNTIKHRLIKLGVDINYESKSYPILKKRIKELYSKGFSLQKIANKLNLWGVKTRSGDGKWHSKTINDLLNRDHA